MPTDPWTLAHALPTSATNDPDLALIVRVWDRLADECKSRLIETARANLCAKQTEIVNLGK